jgi:hypothetical protein
MKWLAAALVLIAGCNRTDLTADQPDMALVADMTVAPDLAMKMTNCGETIICVLGCGTDTSCLPGCLQGADPATYVQVATLGFCAFQNCLSGQDGGTQNMFALLQCVGENCRQEVSMCEGLPFR